MSSGLTHFKPFLVDSADWLPTHSITLCYVPPAPSLFLCKYYDMAGLSLEDNAEDSTPPPSKRPKRGRMHRVLWWSFGLVLGGKAYWKGQSFLGEKDKPKVVSVSSPKQNGLLGGMKVRESTKKKQQSKWIRNGGDHKRHVLQKLMELPAASDFE